MHLILLPAQLSKKSFQVFIRMDSLNGMFWKGAYSRPWIWRCRALKIHSLGPSYQKASTLRRLLLPQDSVDITVPPPLLWSFVLWPIVDMLWSLILQMTLLRLVLSRREPPWTVDCLIAGLWQPFPDNGTFVSCSQQSAHTEENWRPSLLALRCPVQIPSHMAQSHWAVEVWLVRMEMCWECKRGNKECKVSH